LTTETSDFTSVLERIEDRQSAVDIEDTSQPPSSGLAATFSPGALIVPHIFLDASESDPVLNNSLVPNSLVKTALCHFCYQQLKKT